jgi:hypothetical protein
MNISDKKYKAKYHLLTKEEYNSLPLIDSFKLSSDMKHQDMYVNKKIEVEVHSIYPIFVVFIGGNHSEPSVEFSLELAYIVH